MNDSQPLRSFPLFFLFALFVSLTGSASPLAAQDLGLITNVRTLTTDDATRVIISLSRPIRYQLTATPSSPDPREDIPATRLDLVFSAAALAATIPTIARGDDTLLTMVRSSPLSPTTARITLDLTGHATYRILDLRSPYQVVIVLRREGALLTQRRGDAELRTQEEQAPRVEPPPPPLPPPLPGSDVADEEAEPSPEASPLAQTGRRYRIMLDPGHGGHDPGAHGLHDIWEKHVVLAISKRLANK
ncbi:MAG: AMIN domain-containing protein, partial [Deltaproteobacteria bacterium]|nr:AMIN domain-containing protein [Deltaproteobacteria bacterium]